MNRDVSPIRGLKFGPWSFISPGNSAKSARGPRIRAQSGGHVPSFPVPPDVRLREGSLTNTHLDHTSRGAVRRRLMDFVGGESGGDLGGRANASVAFIKTSLQRRRMRSEKGNKRAIPGGWHPSNSGQDREQQNKLAGTQSHVTLTGRGARPRRRAATPGGSSVTGAASTHTDSGIRGVSRQPRTFLITHACTDVHYTLCSSRALSM